MIDILFTKAVTVCLLIIEQVDSNTNLDKVGTVRGRGLNIKGVANNTLPDCQISDKYVLMLFFSDSLETQIPEGPARCTGAPRIPRSPRRARYQQEA